MKFMGLGFEVLLRNIKKKYTLVYSCFFYVGIQFIESTFVSRIWYSCDSFGKRTLEHKNGEYIERNQLKISSVFIARKAKD